MSLDLYVDGPRWRSHLRAIADATPGLVPVAKGNGYGFGLAGLARRAGWLGCDTIAVGTYGEAVEVLRRFDGDVLVLEPWRPYLCDAPFGPRIIHTIGRAVDLAALGERGDRGDRSDRGRGERPRVVLEGLTSMTRHGFTPTDLSAARTAGRGVTIEGHALHLPLGDGHHGEVERWLAAVPSTRWYLSHLSQSELATLQRVHPDTELRPRVGTALWLGDRGSLRAQATVVDVHAVARGDRVGYRQHKTTRDGVLAVVSGGTSHGIGLEAPGAAASPRQRLRSLAKGGLEATGHALSPFVVAGKQRWFVEPPHMQVSMIFVPDGVEPPSIGDLLDVKVRFTTTTFDRVHLS